MMRNRVMRYSIFFIIICLFFITILTPTQPVRATVATFTPVADASIREERPDSNLGSFYQLKAIASPENISFLRFDVQNLDAPVNTATLRLYSIDSSTPGVVVHAVPDNSWNEMTITYNNAPSLGNVINTSGTIAAQSWIEIDVSSYITSEGLFSLAVTTTDTNLLRFFSKEGIDMPELVVETGDGPPTPPPALNADFTAVPVSGNIPLVVTFSDNSTGNITAYDWDFGDGNTSMQPSPVHTYTVPGIYTVSLTVTEAGGGQDTQTRPNYIIVNPASAEIPNASPVITITNPVQGAVLGSYTIQVEGEVSDDGTVQSVLVNNIPANVTGGTFSANIAVSGGNQTINAVAEDEEGAMGFDSTVVQVDDEGPIVDIDQPSHRQSVYTLTPDVDISYHDFLSSINAGTVLVQLTDANNVTTDVTSDLVVTAVSANGTLSTPLIDNSSYTLTVTIADGLGNSSSAQSIFHMANGVTTPLEPANAAWASGVVYDASTCNVHLTTCVGLAGVRITASEIDLDTRETTPISGTIISGPDGFFAFPFDKTGFFTLRFEKDEFTYGQREMAVIRERSTATNAIYLTPLDTAVTPCDSSGCTHTNSNDTIRLDIPAGAIPAGESIDVVATMFDHVEFLPGGDLPPGTWETYAFNLSGAAEIAFTRPITVQIANYRGFAPGTQIPLGYWHQEALQWEHEGVGTVDETGQWLIMYVTHFSNFDCNDPVTEPNLDLDLDDKTETGTKCSGGEEGCYINVRSGEVLEWVDLLPVNVLGELFAPAFSYNTGHANPSEVIDLQLDLLFDPIIVAVDQYVQFELFIEGQKTDSFTFQVEADGDGEVGRYRYLWDGHDMFGKRLPPGVYSYAIKLSIPYTGEYYWSTRFGGPPLVPTGVIVQSAKSTWVHGNVELNASLDSPFGSGWALEGHQQLFEDEAGRILVAEDNNLTEYYNELSDLLDGHDQYNLPQPPVIGPAASVTIPPQPTTGTQVTGTIVTNTLWTLENSPYLIDEGNVTVADGVTLSIEPGVQVMLDRNLSLLVNGAISAVGTPADPITFTAYSNGLFEDWTTYPITNTLLNDRMVVETMAIDTAGNVWLGGIVGGYGGTVGVSRLKPDLTLDSFTLPTEVASASVVYEIVVDGLGQKWFATNRGVAMLAADDVTWTAFTPGNSGLISDYVNAVAVDSSNGVWFGTDSGISHRTAAGTWSTYQQSDGLASNWVWAITIDQDGIVWAGTSSAGLSRFDGISWITYDTSNSNILGDSIMDIAIDNGGNIWLVIASQGVSVLQTSGIWQNYTPGNSDLLNNYVTNIAIDVDGRKWIGYQNFGVSIVSADNQIWLQETYPKLPNAYVNDIAESANGDVWVAANSDAGISRYHKVVYYDGAISGGYWRHLKIGGGGNLNDSDGSQLSYVTLESGGANGQSSLDIDNSAMVTLSNVLVRGSGGDGLVVQDSSNITMSAITTEANEGNGISIIGGSGEHTLTNMQSHHNKGHGLYLAHNGNINVSGAAINDNANYGVFTLATANALTLQDSAIYNNHQAARLAANAILTNNEWYDNAYQQIEWMGGTITGDRTWSDKIETYIILSSITVADGVALTIEPGVDVLLKASTSLNVNGILTAVGTFEKPIYFGRASSFRWSYLTIGGGSVGDSDNSHLSYVIADGGTRGLFLYRSSPTLDHLTLVNNTSYGMYVFDSDDVIIQDSNFDRNAFGLYNQTTSKVVTAVNNYWGSSTGPLHSSNPLGSGQSVSDGVLFDPWRPPVLMDGLNTFAANQTATDYSTLAFDEEMGVYIRYYPDGHQVVFDAQGRHDYTRYPDGRQISYTYNADGIATISITAPGEVTPHWLWMFNYQNGRLDNVVDPAGRTTDFSVDANDHLAQITLPDMSVLSFYYDDRGLMTQQIDRDGFVTEFVYDEYGRLAEHIDPPRAVHDPVTNNTQVEQETHTFTPSDIGYALINSSLVGDPDTPAPAAPLSDELIDVVDYDRGGRQGYTNKWGAWINETDGEGRTTIYKRDAANHATQVVYPDGDCVEYTYDERGNTLSQARMSAAQCALWVSNRDPLLVQMWRYTYDARFNLIKTKTDPLGNTTTYFYDYEEGLGEAGKVVRIVYPSVKNEFGQVVNPTVAYTYNNLGLLDTQTDVRGTVTKYIYTQGTADETANGVNPLFAPGVTPVPGLLTQVIMDFGGENLTTTLKNFDIAGKPGVVSGPDNHGTTTYAYDEMGRVISQTNAVGVVTISAYDDLGRLVRQTVDYTSDGITGRNIVTEFAYNEEDQRVSEQTVADGLTVQKDYVYDINGQLTGERDARGYETAYLYDDADQQVNIVNPTGHVLTTTYTLNGLVEREIDADGYVTRYIYDEFDRLITRIEDENELNLTTTYTYDLNNNLETVTMPDGMVTCNGYDSHNRRIVQIRDCGSGHLNLTTLIAYDLSGNTVYITDTRGIVTYHEYDALNRPTLMRKDDGGLNLETRYGYDLAGNPLQMIDERGIVTSYVYDDLNRLIQSCQDALGLNLCTTYTYDALNNPETVTDPEGMTVRTEYNAFGKPVRMIEDENNLHVVTEYAYDNVLNLVRMTDDNGNSTLYTYTPRNETEVETYADGTTVHSLYDGRGNLTALTLQEGTVITHTYDGAGRLITKTFSTGGEQSFEYDDASRMTSAAQTMNGHQSLVRYGYDALGNVITTSQTLDGDSWATGYSYDYINGMITITYPSGAARVRTLDPLGRLDAVRQGDSSLIADYTYFDLASYHTTMYANGLTNRIDYDPLYRVERISSPVADYQYGYDGADNRTYMQRAHQPGQPYDVYQYDSRYQLTQVWYGADADVPVNITAYDRSQTYTLDDVGNRLEVNNDGISQTYLANNGQQLTNPMNRYDQVDTALYNYDLRGNTLVDSANNYGYDALSRQVSMTGSGGQAEYIYDALGRRLAKVVNGTTTHYVYDLSQQVIEERGASGDLVARYTYGDRVDEVLTAERGGSTYYYHRDVLGSVTEVTDADGVLVERYEYDVYGEPTIFDSAGALLITSAIDNPYLFTGRRYDSESGNYYYRTRMYAPGIGRFLQPDPTGYLDGPNLYTYARNNPVVFYDPSGLYGGKAGLELELKSPKIPFMFGASLVFKFSLSADVFSCCNTTTGTKDIWLNSDISLAAELVWGATSGFSAIPNWLSWSSKWGQTTGIRHVKTCPSVSVCRGYVKAYAKIELCHGPCSRFTLTFPLFPLKEGVSYLDRISITTDIKNDPFRSKWGAEAKIGIQGGLKCEASEEQMRNFLGAPLRPDNGIKFVA